MMTPLARWPAQALNRGPLHMKLSLVKDQLTVSVNGRAFPVVSVPAPITPPEEAFVQFSIQDRVRGAAQASDVDLTLTALHE